MEQIIANLAGAVRRERLEDREYVVVPLTLIVPGVLNGSQGPILYTPDEIQASVKRWNGIHITNGHPSLNGKPLSGRDPRVWEKFGLGLIYNAQIVDQKLKAEGWFDVERVRKVAPEILNALNSGSPIELSTGLQFGRWDSANGIWNDNGAQINYVAIGRQYEPDHLAVLFNKRGACSREMGCGVNVNEANEDQASVLTKIVALVRPLLTTSGQKAADQISNKETAMGLTAEERKAVVDSLILNGSECCGWEEADREVLNKMDEAALNKCKKMMENYKEKKTTENNTPAPQTPAPVANTQTPAPVTPATPVVPQPVKITVNDLPADVQEMIAYGQLSMARDKAALIEKLVANAANKETAKKVYEGMTINQLREIVPAETPASNGISMPQFQFDYSGAGAGQVDNAAAVENAKPDPLGVPAMSFPNPFAKS